MKALRRGLLSTLFGSVALLVSSAALADGEPCINDIDCPGSECGGAVCNWHKSQMTPTGMKYTCNPAGTDPKGSDGWCSGSNSDCKCAALGAVCNAPYCSFTKASDAPPGSGGTGAGGTASTAGMTSTAGTGTAGTGTTTAGTGTTTAPAAKEDDGGCSVGGATNTGAGIALALGVLGLGAAFGRRRR